MKLSILFRLFAGAAVAVACAGLPFWVSRRPERERPPVFVLPHEFAGPFESEDAASLWLHYADHDPLLRPAGTDFEPDRADAMFRVVRVRFTPVRLRGEEAIRRLQELRPRFPSLHAEFVSVGAGDIELRMADPAGSWAELGAAIRAVCGAEVDFSTAVETRRPRIEGWITLKIRPEGRIPGEEMHPRRVTPSVEVRNHVQELLSQSKLPRTVLDISAAGEDQVLIRTRHPVRACLLDLADRLPGVFDLRAPVREAVPAQTGGEERVVLLRVRVGFPYAPEGVIAKLAPLERSLSNLGFEAFPESGGGNVLVRLVDPPDLRAMQEKIAKASGQTVDEAPVESKTRARLDTIWTVRLVRGARLPNGRLLTTRGLSPAEAVRAYFDRIRDTGIMKTVLLPATVVGEDRVILRTFRPGRHLLDALEQTCPGLFDFAQSELEQRLTLRTWCPGGDPALVAALESTLAELRRRRPERYAPLVRDTVLESWTLVRVERRARFGDGTPMTGMQAGRFVALLLRHFLLSGGSRPAVPRDPADLERKLEAFGDRAGALQVRVLAEDTAAYLDTGLTSGFPGFLQSGFPGFFTVDHTEIVLRTKRLDYGVLEACTVPLAGGAVKESGRRWVRSRRFWVRSSDVVGDPESAIRDGRADAAFVADPQPGLPYVDFGLQAVVAAVFQCRRTACDSARDRQLLVRSMHGEAVRLRPVELVLLCRRHRRVSREQAMAVAERLRECGARPVVLAEDDPGFARRIQEGSFDIAIDAFPTTLWTSPGRWWRSHAGGNFSRYSNSELDRAIDELSETFDPGLRGEQSWRIQSHLQEMNVWTAFRRVSVLLCGSEPALRLLGVGPIKGR